MELCMRVNILLNTRCNSTPKRTEASPLPQFHFAEVQRRGTWWKLHAFPIPSSRGHGLTQGLVRAQGLLSAGGFPRWSSSLLGFRLFSRLSPEQALPDLQGSSHLLGNLHHLLEKQREETLVNRNTSDNNKVNKEIELCRAGNCLGARGKHLR